MTKLEDLKKKVSNKRELEKELTTSLKFINERIKEKVQKVGDDTTDNKDIEKLIQEVKDLKGQKQNIEIKLEGFYAAQESLKELALKAVEEFEEHNRVYEDKIKKSLEDVTEIAKSYKDKMEEVKQYRSELTEELNDKKRDTEETIRGIIEVNEFKRMSEPYMGDIRDLKVEKRY